MRQYLDALKYVRDNGVQKGDRTGTGTTEIFGIQTRYNLADGFPAMTTKKLYFKSVAHELLWFLKGTGNIEYLAQNGVHIWDEWPYKNYLEKTGQKIPEINGEEWSAGMKEFIDKIATRITCLLKNGEIWVLFMVSNGENGRTERAGRLTRSRMLLT